MQKKFGIKKLPFFVGCGTFFIAAIVIEGIVHALVLGGGRIEAMMAKPFLYALYGGFMAGLFEETGRFFAYKTLIRKGGEKYLGDENALAYGSGHGGFEAFYILVSGMVTNLFFSIMINSGNAEALLSTVGEAKLSSVMTVINQLLTLNPWYFAISVIERIGAVFLHLAFSVLVWFSVKNKKLWFLYPVAIVLHMNIDMVTAFANSKGLSIILIEVIIYLYTGLCILCAWFVWKKAKKQSERG